jgi:GAF domain-containing protein
LALLRLGGGGHISLTCADGPRQSGADRSDRSAVPHLMEAVAQTLRIRGATAALHSPRDRSTVLVQASDSTAEAAYQLEPRTGEGPIAAVLASGAPVSATGLDVPGRWGRYGPAAAGMGIQAVCAVPLRVPSVRLGVLCCYGTEPGWCPALSQRRTGSAGH